jgi:hypothetical protein
MPDDLVSTRHSLHAVAEQVLAGPQHRRTGSIKLRVAGEGFTTDDLPGEPARIELRGTTLIAHRSSGRRVVKLAGTIAALAEAIDVEPGPPRGVYDAGSGTGPSFLLQVDEASALVLLRALRWGDAALRRFAAAHSRGHPEVPVLWPEHFDVAITLDEVNYGVSPGDEYLAEPYAYVGPWRQRSGPFWNQPFGAAQPVGDLGSEDAVLAFFEDGRRAAAADPMA